MLEPTRDADGYAHIVSLSGGKDSTAMALRLRELYPDMFYQFVCTPTGDELPEMFDHWRRLAELLEQPIVPLVTQTLEASNAQEACLPNFQRRHCTRKLKLEPYKRHLANCMPAVSYVGLRVDEKGREGMDFAKHGSDVALAAPGGVTQRYPMQDWGWTIGDVMNYLYERGVEIPERTDCGRCFYQTISEWWRLWKYHPDHFAAAEAEEARIGHTYRMPVFGFDDDGNKVHVLKQKAGFTYVACHRDSWPAYLRDMRRMFELGYVPKGADQMDLFRQSTCRTCTL